MFLDFCITKKYINSYIFQLRSEYVCIKLYLMFYDNKYIFIMYILKYYNTHYYIFMHKEYIYDYKKCYKKWSG